MIRLSKTILIWAVLILILVVAPSIVSSLQEKDDTTASMIGELSTKDNVELVSSILDNPDGIFFSDIFFSNKADKATIKNGSVIRLEIEGSNTLYFVKHAGVFENCIGECKTNSTFYITYKDLKFTYDNRELIKDIIADQKINASEMGELIAKRIYG